MSQWIGRTVSKVEIQELLGRGGMAEVYLGRHTTLNRPVAVKILHAHLADDEHQRARFIAEAQAIAALRHANIVQVFDFDVTSDSPFIVMELLDGLSLKELMQSLQASGQRLEPAVVVRLAKPLADALDYAHKRGIIHRDIKPANVVIRSDTGSYNPGDPLPDDAALVLTDFGIARMLDNVGVTASGTVIGTPAYMSPEQVQGMPVDARSDIYSFGILLYEMLSGALPFDGDTQAALMVQHITEVPRPLPGGDPLVQRVLDRALSKKPGSRFQAAGELMEALSEAAAGRAYDGTMATEALTASIPAMVPASDTAESPRTTGTRKGVSPLLIGGGLLGGLALVIALLLISGVFGGGDDPVTEVTTPPAIGNVEESGGDTDAGTSPTSEPASTEEAAAPVVAAGVPPVRAFVDDTVLELDLREMDLAEDGSIYEVWLTGAADGIEDPLSLGTVEAGEQVQLELPNGALAFDTYDTVEISVEPASDADLAQSDTVVYRGQFDSEILTQLRTLFAHTLRRSEPFSGMLLSGAVFQVQQHDSHHGFTLDALDGSNLDGAKLHSEHVVNIIAGSESPQYADWNADGRIENPGDDVGLETYIQLMIAVAEAAAAHPEGRLDDATHIESDTDDLLALVTESMDLSQSITSQDTIEGAATLQPFLEPLDLSDEVITLTEEIEALGTIRLMLELQPQ